MGNILSSSRSVTGSNWPSAENTSANMSEENNVDCDVVENNCVGVDDDSEDKNESVSDKAVTSETRKLSPSKEKELEEFRKDLADKREARRKIIKEKSFEMNSLRDQLGKEKISREELIAENLKLKQMLGSDCNIDKLNVSDQETSVGVDSQFKLAAEELEKQIEELKDHLKAIRTELCESNLSLQNANGEFALMNKENVELRKQITALKDVNRVSKELMNMRELQITQLKEKLTLIEQSLEDREMRAMSTELKQEYERQLQNIRNLRVMYEERSRLTEVTRLGLVRELEQQRAENQLYVERISDLEERNKEIDKEILEKMDVIRSQESQLGLSQADVRGLQTEITVINQLFSQMLLGYNPTQDLDKLLLKLEENHDLLKDVVVRGEGAEGAAALPRMLLDLLNQVDDKTSGEKEMEEENTSVIESEEFTASTKSTPASEIVGNLPKVWRVLMELLSHQSTSNVSEISEKSAEICYKSVETPSGPRLVPSVSKTYIRLKDLILEKKSLQKETNRLKQLNSHLESRLQDQERRLCLVGSELSKTWRIVGKMERQHQQLHTHEKILRYELQQKRKMLTELKEQLEFCKEKWDKAKEKNSQSQLEWDKLRQEFSKRKLTSVDSINNSAESGYSDEKPSDSSDSSDDEEDISEKRRSKRKSKSPETNGGINPMVKFIKAKDNNDTLQDEEELPVEGADILSDGDFQANLADTEDQSISESTSEQQNQQTQTNTSGCLNDVIEAESVKLKKLEKKCSILASKVERANNEGVELCSKLEQLHNQYGGGGESIPSTSSEETSKIEENLSVGQENSNENSIVQTERLNSLQSEGSVSNDNVSGTPNKSISEYEARFAAREERLKRMEEQAKSLVRKVTDTSTRSVVISTKLDELHNVYGRSEEDQTEMEESNLNGTEISECTDSIDRKEQSNNINSRLTDNLANSEITNNELKNMKKQDSVTEQAIEYKVEEKETKLTTSKDSLTENNEAHSSKECDKLEERLTEDLKMDQDLTCSTSNSTGSSDVIADCEARFEDYEARFAVRDERLRRMEEQAKSLVQKVSDTTTRGVKIGFKLDELHNVYGRSLDQSTEEDADGTESPENTKEELLQEELKKKDDEN